MEIFLSCSNNTCRLTLIDVLVVYVLVEFGWKLLGSQHWFFFYLHKPVYIVYRLHNSQGNAFWIHFVFYVTRENYDILATDFPFIFGKITYGLLLFKLYMIWSLTCLHRVVNIPRSIQADLVTGEFIVNLLEWTNKGQSVNTTL